MLALIRQHKQLFSMLLLPALVLVWLSFSCQNCFADSQTESAQKMHAAMDCCPMDAHSEHEHGDKQGCDTNYLINQPVLSDHGAAKLVDFSDVVLPITVASFTAVYPLLIQPIAVDRQDDYFSDRHFSSYRILLI